MSEADTIAAIATPPGQGAIAIVRCSGSRARQIAARVFRSATPLADRVATYGTVLDLDGRPIDRGLAIAMDAPRTVTGEDIVELHVHGSPVTARETLRGLIAAGARLAEPGEFTRRAYLNGKIDLSAAEAVADLIAAESRAAAHAATANLNGGLRRLIASARLQLRTVLEELAAAIDFPDEVAMPDSNELAARLDTLAATLRELLHDAERGRLIREGLALGIVGPPNAGKSSLLNALVGEERAIVSPFAGTTRDTIEENFAIDGVVVRAIDTAGLRATSDAVERIGIERARRAMAVASVLLIVLDGSTSIGAAEHDLLVSTRGRPRVVFFNKSDLGSSGFDAREPAEADAIGGSLFDSSTLDRLRSAIAHTGWGAERLDANRPYLSGARQTQAVVRGLEAVDQARATLAKKAPIDLVTGDLITASAALAEITGSVATEALLDGIFARFCIGK